MKLSNYDLFSKNLRNYISENNLTVKKFAENVGLHESTISYYCNGTRTPSYEQLIKICKYIGCSIDEILCTNFNTKKSLDEYSTEELIAEICKRISKCVTDMEEKV